MSFKQAIIVGVLIGSFAYAPSIEARLPLPLAELAAIQNGQHLVSQLAAAKFSERERAEQELIRMGLPALSLVRAGLNSTDTEVRLRCLHIFTTISRADRPRRLAMLLSGQPVDQLSRAFQLELPGWESLRRLAGDNKESRRFMGLVLKTEWDFLQQVSLGEAESWVLISRRCGELRGETRTQPRLQQDGPAVAALLIAAAVRDRALPESTAIQLYSLLQQVGRARGFNGTSVWQDETFRTLVGRFIASANGPTATYQSLSLCAPAQFARGPGGGRTRRGQYGCVTTCSTVRHPHYRSVRQ